MTKTDAPPLDWTIHRDQSRWVVSSKAFLAEAILITGRVLCVPWSGQEPTWMSLPRRSPVPFADEAYFNGQPIDRIHATFGPEIRAAISPASYLLNLIQSDPVAWHQDELPYPADASLAALELRARNNEDGNDPITQSHWNAGACQINSEIEQLDVAERALRPIAEFVAKLALSARIRTYTRRFGGGTLVELEPSLWELDNPLARAASCSLNIDDPFNHHAPPTHFIFVERQDLEQALASLNAADKIYLIEELEGGNREGRYAGAAQELTEWICERAEDPYSKDWRRAHWEEAAGNLGSWASGSVFDDAWTAATKLHPRLIKVGRPRRDENPNPIPDRSNVYSFRSKTPH